MILALGVAQRQPMKRARRVFLLSRFCTLPYFMRPGHLGILIVLVLSSAQALSQEPPNRARDIGSLGQVNWGYVRLEATGTGGPIFPWPLGSTDTEMALYDANGILLEQNDDISTPDNRNSRITWNTPVEGRYYLAVALNETIFLPGFVAQSLSAASGRVSLDACREYAPGGGGGPPFSSIGSGVNPFSVNWFTFTIESGGGDPIDPTDCTGPTDPTDPTDPEVRVVGISHDAERDTTQLTWESAPGQFFEIAKSTDLRTDPATWPRILTEIEASPGAETSLVVDEAAVEAQAFYKVFQTPPPALTSGDGSSREQAIILGRIPSGQVILDTMDSVVGDTEIGLYLANGNLLASNDDDTDLGLLSRITISLAPGTYYIATGAYNTTFNPRGFSVVAPSGIPSAFVVNARFLNPAPRLLRSSGVNTSGAVWFSLVVE